MTPASKADAHKFGPIKAGATDGIENSLVIWSWCSCHYVARASTILDPEGAFGDQDAKLDAELKRKMRRHLRSTDIVEAK